MAFINIHEFLINGKLFNYLLKKMNKSVSYMSKISKLSNNEESNPYMQKITDSILFTDNKYNISGLKDFD